MPELVKEPVEFSRRGPVGSIHWGPLTDGRTYRLVFGKDFSGESLSVQSSAHQAATRRGLRVRTTTQGSDVIVQFYDPNEPSDKAKTKYRRQRGGEVK